MDLSIIVPCFNEEDCLPEFFEAATSTFDGSGLVYELVFVNDGSRDATSKLLHDFVQSGRAPHVRVIDFSRNFGKEPAVLAGLEHATGDVVGFIDSDMQQLPETLLAMYRKLLENPEYDIVAAFQEHRREGAVRRFLKQSFYHVFSKVTKLELLPDASDFRVFRRSVADALRSMPEYYRFSKGLFAWVGFETLAFPYTPNERAGGESKWSLRKLFRYALSGMLAFSTMPLRVSSIAGGAAAIVGIIAFVMLLADTFVHQNTPAGYPTLLSLILFFGGLILLTLGIIGEYIARIYIEGKNRPIYIARAVTSNDNGVLTHDGSPRLNAR